jgi:sugar lactone lactonase YvrE
VQPAQDGAALPPADGRHPLARQKGRAAALRAAVRDIGGNDVTRRSRLLVAGACLAAGLGAAARAQPGDLIDFGPLEQYVAQQDAATATGPKPVHKAWKSLDAKLARDAKGVFAVDLAKLAALSKAANGPLVADLVLRTRLDAALDAADAVLQAEPDSLATLIGEIKVQKNRDRVLAMVVAAQGLEAAGRTARDGGNEALQIRDWTKCNAKLRAAAALANQIIKKQGGPLPQFKTAKAAHVYTVVGQGEGGFNGDDREARRTQLYYVEKCRHGPDGQLYILDWNNHMLRRREDATGRITRLCGSGVPGDSEGDPMTTQLNHPSEMAFEPTTGGTLGKIYIAAWHNHKVKVYDPTGGIDARYAGKGPQVYTIAGTVQGGGIVSGVDTSGDGHLATLARYNLLPGIVIMPVDTAIASKGDLLTADAANEVVRRIALSSGTTSPNLVSTVVLTGQITRVAGTRGATDTTGSSASDGDGGPALSCTLNFSKAENAEPDGRMEFSPDHTKLYIVCGQSSCVRVMDLNTGVINRFAGTGVAGYSGDGGPAALAQLNRPADVAVAPDGTVFVSDSYNNVIRRITTDGAISTYAGSTSGASGAPADLTSDVDDPIATALFDHPSGLELDADGNLYVCDRLNNVIRVITSANPGTTIKLPVAPYVIPTASKGGPPKKGATGTIATYAGSGGTGFNTDESNPRLALDTDLYWPQDCAVDPNLNLLYIVDWNNHRIRRVEDNGTIRTVVGSGLLGDQGGEGPDAKLNHPTDITFHPVTGELWIAAWHTDKIIRLDASTNQIYYVCGVNARSFGGDGGPASTPASGVLASVPVTTGFATLNLPVSVKFTSNGDWYIADEGNQRVRRVDGATDIINTILGDGTQSFLGDGGPAASAEISLPVGQAAQPAGRVCISPGDHYLYIADTNNNRVRRVDLTDPQRTIVTVAGNGNPGYAGDGGPATDAQLNFPVDVDCDAAGNVYVVDSGNSVVRKVAVDGQPGAGTITTVAGNGISGYSGDGGPATDARLQRPGGIFVVRTGPNVGRMYIADTFNSVVRVVWE